MVGEGAAGSSGSYAARDFSTAHLRAAVDRSLQRLGTDHIDLYQLHGPPAVCGPEVAALMADLRAAGKIRGFGVGLESLEHALAWLDVPGLDALQLPFGVLDPEARERVIPAASQRGVHVVARAVFAAGLLNDPSPDAVAVLRPAQRALQVEVLRIAVGCGVHPLGLAAWFARDCAGVSTVLVGASSQHHLQENLALFRTPRPADEAVAAVESAIRAYERRRDAASGGDAEGRAS